jgi:hypothetical protein
MHSAQDVFHLLKHADPKLIERIYQHTLQVLASANAGKPIEDLPLIVDPELEIQGILDKVTELAKQPDMPWHSMSQVFTELRVELNVY